jgi:murein DD-endopeptidase MepM/ murein hydrolase activator NlpD
MSTQSHKTLLMLNTVLLWAGPAQAQDHAFPTSGTDYAEFYPTAYKDHGGVDWNCGDIRYSGHNGSDYGVGSWTGMDAGRDVHASAPGVVVYSHDGEYDRCSTGDCPGGSGCGNYVKIQHPDGKYTLYCHMTQWSVAVSEGDAVGCGTYLGLVGSSGHSTGPHLHFEVRNSGDVAEDPFDGPCSAPPPYWTDQGVYGELPALVCDDVPVCEPIADLSCGDTYSGSNSDPGSTSTHLMYGCTTWTYSGPELAFRVASDRDETITLSLGGLSADLDLYVLDSPACDATDCLASADGPDTSDEVLSFDARAGHPYTVVVDGYEGALSALSLRVDCAGAWPGSPDTGSTDGGGDGASDGADGGASDGGASDGADGGASDGADGSTEGGGTDQPDVDSGVSGDRKSPGTATCTSTANPKVAGLLALTGLGIVWGRRHTRRTAGDEKSSRRP